MLRHAWCGWWLSAALALGGCGMARGSLVVGTSAHPYVFAFSPSRHIIEWPAEWWRVFYYDGMHVMAATVHNHRLVGPPQRISQGTVAPGFSITLSGDTLYLVYSGPSDITAYLRTATLDGNTLSFTEARPVVSGQSSFSVQCPSVAMSPDGHLTVVYRSIVGAPNRMPVYIVQATDRAGTTWGAPIEVTTPEQRAGSGAGTSGAAFWPGGQLTVLLATDILYANTRTPEGWTVHRIDPDYHGTHDFSGALLHDTLYVSYRADFSTTGADGFMRWIAYHPSTGWSSPHDLAGAPQHSTAMGLDPEGTPVVFGVDQTNRWLWHSVGMAGATETVRTIGPRRFRLSWLAVPEQFRSALACAWVDKLTAPYQVRFWVGPPFKKDRHEPQR